MKTTQDKAHVQRWRDNHHKALESLALRVGCRTPGLRLWRQLRQLEAKLYSVCLNYTNGERGVTLTQWEHAKTGAKIELARIFGGKIPDGVFINGDPRGHMLKLDSDAAAIPDGMQTDWGRDGILAATIDSE